MYEKYFYIVASFLELLLCKPSYFSKFFFFLMNNEDNTHKPLYNIVCYNGLKMDSTNVQIICKSDHKW